MLHFPRWKVLAILAVVLAGVVFALPNVLPKPWQDMLRDHTGLQPMTRGLDLQGGTSVLMEIDGKELTDGLIVQQMSDVRAALRGARIGYKLNRTPDGVTVQITDIADIDKAYDALRNANQPIDSGLFSTVAAKHIFNIDRSGHQVTFRFDEAGLNARISQATEQALQVLNNRLNGFGIKEVSVQRQGLNRILIQVPGEGLSDQAKRALGLIGALAFQMTCESPPAAAADSPPGDCGVDRISGNFTGEYPNNLVIALRSGALPARLVYIDAANESAGGAQAKRSDL